MEPRAAVPRSTEPAAAGRPNPGPSRLALGVGGLAAASALVTAIVSPAAPAAIPLSVAPPGAPTSVTITRQRPVQYVQLTAGQSPPPGGTVIDARAPKPITVVTRVPAPQQQTVVVRTTQSGRVLP